MPFTDGALDNAKTKAGDWLRHNKNNLIVSSVSIGSGTHTILFRHAHLSELKRNIEDTDGVSGDFTLEIHGHFKTGSDKRQLGVIHIKCLDTDAAKTFVAYLATLHGNDELDSKYIKCIHDKAANDSGNAEYWTLSDAYRKLQEERRKREEARQAQRRAAQAIHDQLEREEQQKREEEARRREAMRQEREAKAKRKPPKTEDELIIQNRLRAQALQRAQQRAQPRAKPRAQQKKR